ncbi:MAG: YIP1 family protein [Clostridia bacterium]|nr:YIP1 family protein [Clostridia bacterium]
MGNLIKKLSCILLAFMLLSLCVFTAAASVDVSDGIAYNSYTYDNDFEPVAIPAPFTAVREVSGGVVGASNFLSPADICYSSESGYIYIADSGNNAVVVLDSNYNHVITLSVFDNGGKSDSLISPSSMSERDGKLYVADTGNSRIVCFNVSDFSLLKIYPKPVISQLGEYSYKPTRLCVDMAGRIYVVAQGINKGLLLLNEEGIFQAFLGAPDVVVDFWDGLWKKILGKEQRSGLLSAVPTEYNSVSIDEKGFLYATTQSQDVEPIVKLNSQGENVLYYTDNYYPNADGWYTKAKIQPFVVDMTQDDKGNYFLLDSKTGRIYGYDVQGNMLYAFSGIGRQIGTSYSPCAIEYIDGKLIVLDGFYGTFTIYERTEFGNDIYLASSYMEMGDYEQAEIYWNNVYRTVPAYIPACIGIGRIATYNGEYTEALSMLEYTQSKDYYSEAFVLFRKTVMQQQFDTVVIVLTIIGVAAVAIMVLQRKKKIFSAVLNNKLISDYRYASYCCFHPFDGFWDLKREKRGNLRTANILFLLFTVLCALRIQMSGFLFSNGNNGDINVIVELLKVLLPLILWCISNWCFTTLMDGEGSFKDIYIALCYSLKPYITAAVPLLLLSHFLTAEEAFIYTTLDQIVWIWVIALIFLSMVTTHDYSMSKGVLTAILSLVGVALMIFIGIVFSNMVEDFIEFAGDIYRELMYRFY